MESSPSTPAPATPGTAKLRPGTDARISTGATDKMRSTASSNVSSRATTASSAMPSTADPSKRPLSRSNKKSSAPPSATSTTRTRSPSTKPRISLLPNLGMKKKKSKKKKKKKPIIEDPKLVRDMLAFAESNNVQALRHILDSDEYDKRYDLMNTAGETLVVAAMKGHIDVMELLCQHLPSIVNVNGGRPLQRAALAGQLEACEYLLSHGADHNLKATFTDWSCLHYAVQSGSVEVVRCLIQQGAKIDATLHYEHSGLHNGWAPIHFAADLGFYDIIQCLIESHAQIDLQTTDGETALSIAAEHGRWDCVQWMVACGANIHAVRRGLSVVQWAIYRGAEQAVQFLVSYGAQPDLNVKVLWFPGDVTLHQLIKSEFSEAVYDQIDLAIYRGSLQVRERQIKRKLLSEVSWVHTPVYDPYSFDPLPPPTIRTFPESIVNLISAYEM